MSATLEVIAGPDNGKTFPLGGNRPLLLGRSQVADIRLHDRGVSRAHCQIVRGDNQFYVFDTGSRQGTLLNGERIHEQPLEHLDVLRVGNTTLRLLLLDLSELDTAVPSPTPHSGTQATQGQRQATSVGPSRMYGCG